MLFDKTENTGTRPHELLVLPKAAKLRYVRLTNTAPLTGQLSLFDLRVFGIAKGKKPAAVTEMKVRRSFDRRRFDISWPEAEGAKGYFVHWGVSPDELYSACQTLEPHLELGLFSADQEYYFRVDAFNDCGVTRGK